MVCPASNTRSNSSVILSRLDGWIPLNGLYDPGTFPVNINTAPWTPTSVRSIGFAANTVLQQADKIKVVTNLGAHYGIVTSVSATAATVTSLDGAVYRPNPTVAANTVVNEVWFSRQANPFGWPGWLQHTILAAEFLSATYTSSFSSLSAVSVGSGNSISVRVVSLVLRFSFVAGGNTFRLLWPPGITMQAAYSVTDMYSQGGFIPFTHTNGISGVDTVSCLGHTDQIFIRNTAGVWPINTDLYLNIMYTGNMP